MKILVTGAAGFIGSKLVVTLSQNHHEVTALIHEKQLEDNSIRKIRSDITDPDLSLPDDHYDIVYHLAAVTPLEKNKKILKRVNYDGTVNFFNKIKNKTKFFIHINGLGVFGDAAGIVNEKTPLKPHTDYAKIRLEAQKYLESQCKENSIPFTVVYLGEVYGKGGWFTSQFLERLKNGKFKIPKSGEYYRNFIHVDDAANALVIIGEKNIENSSFIVTDGHPTQFKEFINYACDLLGLKHPGGVPTFLAKAVLGGDFVKLLTTSTRTSNEKISKIYEFKFPTYQKGVEKVISEID